MMTIADYWQLSHYEQVKVRQEAKAIVLGSGKDLFTVSGIIEYEEEYTCDCEFCQGHTHRETLCVSELVVADTEEAAAEEAATIALNISFVEQWRWTESPEVTVYEPTQ